MSMMGMVKQRHISNANVSSHKFSQLNFILFQLFLNSSDDENDDDCDDGVNISDDDDDSDDDDLNIMI